jgi:putative redox protein
VVVSASGQEKYLAEIFNGTAGILSDTTEEKGGSGKYFRPHDLLEAALASCLNITTRMVLEAMNLSCDKVTVKVEQGSGAGQGHGLSGEKKRYPNRWNL